MKRVSTIIIDDEPGARDYIELLLKKLDPEIQIAGKAENAQQALEMITDLQPDLIFLDIVLPGNDGFWLIDKLSKLGKIPSIIFVSAYDEQLKKAMNYASIDALHKPLSMEQVQEAVKRFYFTRGKENIFEKIEKLKDFINRNKIDIETKEGTLRLFANEIVFCKTEKENLRIYLIDGKEIVAVNPDETQNKQLAGQNFIKINRSVKINKNLIEEFIPSQKKVVLSDTLQKYEFKVSSEAAKKLMNL